MWDSNVLDITDDSSNLMAVIIVMAVINAAQGCKIHVCACCSSVWSVMQALDIRRSS